MAAGSNLTYTINLSNIGSAAANSVNVADALPSNAKFVSASVTTGTGWGLTAPAPGASSGTINFSKSPVDPAEAAVFQVIVNVNAECSHRFDYHQHRDGIEQPERFKPLKRCGYRQYDRDSTQTRPE